MIEWQPAIVVDAHRAEVQAAFGYDLHPGLVALFGKMVEVREEGEPHPKWKPFCDSRRAFRIRGHNDLWLCEHEILTD